MRQVVIWGAGGTGKRIYKMIKNENNIIGFIDNIKEKWGTKIDGIQVYPPEFLLEAEFDNIIIGTLMGEQQVRNQILAIDASLMYKIETKLLNDVNQARIVFLNNYAQLVEKNGIKGNVGEAGVYQGEFAKYINEFFPDRTCYLFDTFDGFDESDYRYEEKKSELSAPHFKLTNEEIVLEKMKRPENIKIYKGHFPETAKEIVEKFCFINLDMDLFKPTLEGLRLFYPMMVKGGIILIHDYFSESYPNVEQAVYKFQEELGEPLKITPIGDGFSLAVIK